MPGERGQQPGQLGVRTGQLILDAIQGLLLPCAEAHDGPFRVSLAARGYALAIARVKEVVLPPLHGGAARSRERCYQEPVEAVGLGDCGACGGWVCAPAAVPLAL